MFERKRRLVLQTGERQRQYFRGKGGCENVSLFANLSVERFSFTFLFA